jgi:hypothetical protein
VALGVTKEGQGLQLEAPEHPHSPFMMMVLIVGGGKDLKCVFGMVSWLFVLFVVDG